MLYLNLKEQGQHIWPPTSDCFALSYYWVFQVCMRFYSSCIYSDKKKSAFHCGLRMVFFSFRSHGLLTQIKVDSAALGLESTEYGDDNPLILPSKKRKTTKVSEPGARKKVLSKKEKRRLQCVVDRKKKREKVRQTKAPAPRCRVLNML